MTTEESNQTPPTAAPLEVKPVESTPMIDIAHFAAVQLRVGLIKEAEAVPKSKKLLKLQVDLGAELGTRQVLSGIAQYYQPENLIGKRVVIVANLKPAQMMGLESQGMLLAVMNQDGSSLSTIEVPEHFPEGSTVR